MSIDAMDRNRRRMLAGVLIGFGMMQGVRVLNGLGLGTQTLQTVLVGIGLLGWLLFVVSMVQVIRFNRQLAANPQAAAAMSDEMWQQNRSKSFMVAFAAVMVCQVVLLLAGITMEISAVVSADLTILVGVASVILSFLYFDRG